jgi:enoyl-CoA hydratase/carnithine racemase
MTDETPAVRTEVADGVATVTVDVPPVNALGARAFLGLEDAAERLGTDAGVRAVVLTGAGTKAFMAGADITEFEELQADPLGMPRRMRWARQVFTLWARLPQPVIAAVQATAAGGGLEMALLCDIIVADRTARLGLPEARLGLIPAGGGTVRLTRRVGAARAKQLMMLGQLIDADQALAIGLADRVADAGTTLRAAQDLAAQLAAMPGVAVRAIKRAVDGGAERDLEAALDIESAAFMTAYQSADFKEGYRAFTERRPPQFTHR